MAKAQHIENEANPEQLQGTPNPAMNQWTCTKPRKKPSKSSYDSKALLSSIGMYQTSATVGSDKQLRSARQTNRSDFNFTTLANSTPIRNDNTRPDQPGVHFNTNTVCHVYSTASTSSREDQYEPPINDSILQGAGSTPTDLDST